ncbi:hypothetical protein PIROE2DRAFT_14264, partial [Piromyces sp. E2]
SYVKSIKIKNENELLQVLSNSEKELILDFDSPIDITHNIIINQSIEKLIFRGGDLSDTFILNSVDSSFFTLDIGENVKEIQLENLSIKGNLFFNNNQKILINSVFITGNIHSNFEKHINEYFRIYNLTYKPSNLSIENCIHLDGGNIEIYNSNFRGSISCQKRLLNFNGLNVYKLFIMNSKFNGEYQCSLINVDNALNVNIEKSSFEKAYSEFYGG